MGEDDPRSPEVLAVLRDHWAFATAHTPIGDVHALDLDGLLAPGVTFYSVRLAGTVVAVGALRDLGDNHFEVKSMHTVVRHRRQGWARRLLGHLEAAAREMGAVRLSLETGSDEPFSPALRMYAAAGFEKCGPFGHYPAGRGNTFMTKPLSVERS